MASSPSTLRRLDDRVSRLIRELPNCLNRFESSGLFTGPSIHFHVKTLELRRSMELRAALSNDAFFTYLYATLTAWGMHRMGPGNTKLIDFQSFCTTIQRQADALSEFATLHLVQMEEHELPGVASRLWRALSEIRVSPAEAKIVSSTKVSHHLLPALLPPIDRQYSFNFFYGRQKLSISDDEAFDEMFSRIHRIGREGRKVLEARMRMSRHPMATSVPKLIDNAIVGCVLANRAIVK